MPAVSLSEQFPVEFIVKTALDLDNDEKRKSRQKLAKGHSWETRSDQLRVWIEEILEFRNVRTS